MWPVQAGMTINSQSLLVLTTFFLIPEEMSLSPSPDPER